MMFYQIDAKFLILMITPIFKTTWYRMKIILHIKKKKIIEIVIFITPAPMLFFSTCKIKEMPNCFLMVTPNKLGYK